MKHRLETFSICLWLLMGACSPQKMSVEEVIRKADPAVVSISSLQNLKPFSSGTGFIIDAQGLIATNYHVIRNADAVVVKLANGKTFPVLGVVDYNFDEEGYPDFALLKIDPDETLPVLPMGDPAKLVPGERVVTIGDPIGFSHSVSSGDYSGARVFTAVNRLDSVTYLQTTAPISPGNSGGPLLNLYGEVVGINTFHNRLGQNLNFSLSVAHINDAMIRHGHSARFTLAEVLAKQKARDEEQFKRYFTLYNHPSNLFSMLYPRHWKTYQYQYWRYATDPDTSYVQSSVIAPEGAYNPQTGYLSGGIRVIFYQPRSGQVWTQNMVNRWGTAFKRRTLANNDGFAFTPDSAAIALDNIPARMYKAIGQNGNVREIEVDRFIVVSQPNYLLSIELACPSSQQADYDQYYAAILQSFRFGIRSGTWP
ncbi:hypothetical protein GCM10023187_47680 [Nibrella viscosa]|uniref:Trypsin-like peptidase domain-containing protein n=1 Tax=Nibrella viscosa TaxID=1084524 RepID=A0ABP8KUD2_9BACT